MLDLTSHPRTSTHAAAAIGPVPAVSGQPGPTLDDMHAHVAARRDISDKTRDRYLSAITKAGERLNKPLAVIPAELALLEERFPLDGFDPTHWSTDTAYQLFRRRLQAPLREFLGVHKKQAALRAQEDDWTILFAAIEPLSKGKVGRTARWHPMKLSMLRTFAIVARAYGWQPRDLTLAEAQRIDADFRGNKREANARALRRLDELREFPQILPLLPPHPIGFSAKRRAPLLTALHPSWEAQFLPWIEAVTRTGWDPVGKVFADDHAGHAHVLRAAFRTALRIGVEIGAIGPDQPDLKAILAEDEILCAIAGEMFARRLRTRRNGRLEPRTSRKYLKGLNQVRAHLGIDTTMMKLVLANNSVSRMGKKADRCMTPTNRKFCEGVVEKPALRRRFLGAFKELRATAQSISAQIAAEDRKPTPREIARVRMLGAAACFAAIEIGGAPIRVENAMRLTCVGEDAQIRIPESGKKPIKVLIPAELTKNKAEIAFPVRANKHGCHDTIRWYLQVIRPMFPHAATSPFLFPAIKTQGAHFNPDFFGAEFAGLMRTVVNMPMTPHQMRHGQTSLLLDRHPNEIEVIAKRIDDTLGTLRQFYGWLNSMKLVEHGQDLLVGLMED
ncbi:hypothetical protein EDD52_1157 [Primorskyibacter sedentarius]|uniref:Phage integrase family protein n=1 Tax=Primorskyibacter sedentarius TaxID=745311 RepID=A0A4R3J6V8_9RHOB|nr:hypothetical protein [Primorskyibacter sedentarius]TCS60190.1 hypothetical protein EDD52_1157 [Primorskyibacter sedentarius]